MNSNPIELSIDFFKTENVVKRLREINVSEWKKYKATVLKFTKRCANLNIFDAPRGHVNTV